MAPSPAASSSDEQVTAAEKSELAVPHLPDAPAADFTVQNRNITLGLVFSALALVSVAALIYQFRTVEPVWAALLAVPTLLLLVWGMATRGRFPRTATGLLAGVLALVPLNLLAVGYCTGQLSGAGLLVAWSIAAVLALPVMFIAARSLGVPWALPTAMAAAVLASAKLALRDEYLRFIPTYRGYVEFLLLGVLALGVAAMLLGLYRRRREKEISLWLGAKAGALLLLWPFALVCAHLFTDFSDQLQAEWIGAWLVGLGILFLLTGLAFLRVHRTEGQSPIRAVRPTRGLAVVLMGLAGVAALAGLLLSDGHVMGMLVSLVAIFVTTALLGAHGKGREVVVFQAIASVALPVWAAIWALKVAGLAPEAEGSLIALAVSSVTAATGFALANILVYLFGLLLAPRQGRWTRSPPLVSSLALGTLGWFWLARLGGVGLVTLPGTAYQAAVPSIYLLFALPAVLMVTAWRVRWELTVCLACWWPSASTPSARAPAWSSVRP
ncbi:MAG: hypothetical protein GWP05_04005 [Anaerolineaceae bacterium]|nr:hypothetical protein [Anaerolineaceae bacterium]